MVASVPSILRQSRRQRLATSMIPHTPWSNRRIVTLMLLALFVVVAKATDEKTAHSAPASPSSTLSSSIASHKDEIYIDDEGIEGSGGHGGIHDDLEKDPDYSGSGFGPDDEDSSTDQHHRRPSIHTQTGISKQHTNDNNDLISGRTHQTNSGTHQIIGGGGQTGNSGIISGSGSGNTGLNTIGKNYSSSSSSSSTPTTKLDHKNPNHHTTISSSSLYPIDTHISQSSSISPQHTDDDDIDLDETQGGFGSGDGGIIDRHGIDDDDDNTGDDDDNDGDDDIIHGRNNYNVGGGINRHKNVDAGDIGDDDTTDIDEDAHRHQTISGGSVGSSDHKPATHDDDFDEEEEEDNYDETEDEDGETDGGDGDGDSDSDDGTEMYTDVTDPSGSDTTTHKRPGINNQGTIHELDTNSINSLPPDTKVVEHTTGNEVFIMSDDDRTTSFFAQPGILAAVIGGAVVGLLCAILVVMFIVYRMRKKDEGSYALDEPKRSPAVNSYAKNANNREFYA